MGEMKEGLVIKGIGGFYYVQCGDVLHACRARGKFRKDKISPYAGDRVRIEVDANDAVSYTHLTLPTILRAGDFAAQKLSGAPAACKPR